MKTFWKHIAFGGAAQMATNMPEVVGVRLSENLSLPVTNKIKTCVMRFASDCTRQFAPADFSYDNDKVFNLPGTTFSVEKDKEGRQCIYLNVKVARGQENGNWGVVTNPKTWSGNLDTEKAGEDYYMISGVSTKSATSMKNAYACDPYNFAGDSFSMMGSTTTQATLTDVSRILTIKLRMGYNSYLNLAQSSQGNIGPSIVINGLAWNRPRTLQGTIFIDGSATLAKPAKIYSQLTTNRCQITSAISGPGVLLLQTQATSNPWQSGYASAQTPTPFALYGNNSDFTGQLVIRPNGPTTYARYLVKNASAFGGEPESALADAVLLDGTQATDKLIQIEAESSIDVAAVNRGWSVTYATFRSPSGVTFKFRSPLTLKNKLIKGGAGTLEFGPVAMSTPNGSASLVVDEGWLRQIDETSLRNVDVSVASGAGFVADPQAAYGVRAHSITAAERISVKAIPPEGSKAPFKVALCTVPEGNGDLSGSFEFEELDGFVAPVSGLAKQALSGEDAGWVRYTMKFSPPGMTILLR